MVEKNELLSEVIGLVSKEQKCSPSFLQRKLRIGYDRACKIIDFLEEGGMIGPPIGNKPRDIFIK